MEDGPLKWTIYEGTLSGIDIWSGEGRWETVGWPYDARWRRGDECEAGQGKGSEMENGRVDGTQVKCPHM
jgi:hypothetical protein